MSTKIRLKRFGKKRNPTYRVIVIDSRKARDGQAIEEIGLYDPNRQPSFIEINSERALYWLGVGAQPSDQVKRLLELTGDYGKFKGDAKAKSTVKPQPAKLSADEKIQASLDQALKLKADAAKKEAEAKKAAEEAAKAEAEAAAATAEATAEAEAATDAPTEAEAATDAPTEAEATPASETDAAEAPVSDEAPATQEDAPAEEAAEGATKAETEAPATEETPAEGEAA